ncbi:lipopolysaccharide assembly protein LapA domain-containing protein [Arthrobacter sp. NicSoilB8]|uniref:LapA family protein n=1 Tax=Arthrobacter sp. NicSoilB8 TaxID=2830998 RepID=UPI001CC6E0FC|nr:lipopolysaccharide assembly protein LapA domain-containing protein [Arthrobacter sp. NicSoilB8]BCW71714.1 hypothetical protein NicSoilB8_27580 [Arthrobacter sp. NicSoilB8]
MTQTPRSSEPGNPEDTITTPNMTTRKPGDADITPGSAGPGYTAGVPGSPDPDSGTPVAGTPAAGTTPPQVETARAETPKPAPAPETRQVTRAGMVWAAVACALVVLILLIAFILQNQEYVLVKFFGLQGSVPLGIALFIAAVGGGVLVAIAGAARIIQLRLAAHRQRVSRRTSPGTGTR